MTRLESIIYRASSRLESNQPAGEGDDYALAREVRQLGDHLQAVADGVAGWPDFARTFGLDPRPVPPIASLLERLRHLHAEASATAPGEWHFDKRVGGVDARRYDAAGELLDSIAVSDGADVIDAWIAAIHNAWPAIDRLISALGEAHALLDVVGIDQPVSAERCHERQGSATSRWAEVRANRPMLSQVAHCASEDDADLIAALINAALATKAIVPAPANGDDQ